MRDVKSRDKEVALPGPRGAKTAGSAGGPLFSGEKSSPGSPRRRRTPLGLLIGGGLTAAALVAAFVAAPRDLWEANEPADGVQPVSNSLPPADPIPLTPISDSPFLNTRADAQYVGSETCQACHEKEHESFRHSGMGRSMAAIDLSREPPDGQFDHSPSRRRYEVLRKDGKMWHRELLLTDGHEEVVLEFPVKYVTGSGRHSLTYVVETDGFLVESPITWYASRQAWGMSPGYDRPEHSGFQREVGEGCLVCHAGRAEAIEGSLHRMRVIEESIGCERCHGPGSLHVEKRSAANSAAGDAEERTDDTIVNPARLSRELAEAVCQQCHLRASATVVSRGRKISDFRPGLPLADFRQDYSLEIPDKPMTVVGHVEQMHMSRCYQQSETFTCATCHSPHGEPSAEEKTAYYKAACLKCHEAEHCTVNKERLAKESAENNCVQCHMPTSPTDIPHLAFTHHRVGIYGEPPMEKKAAADAKGAPGMLKPFLDLSRLSAIDQKRSLGLAYLDLAIHEERASRRVHYQEQAFLLLTEVHAAGLKDGTVDASLASLRFELKLGDVIPYAQSALADRNLGGMERSNALFLMADAYFNQERYEDALAVLEPLNRLRRHSVQWLLKAKCEKERGDEPAMEESLLTAVHINPRNDKAQRFLAEYYRKKGKLEKAAWHERMAGP